MILREEHDEYHGDFSHKLLTFPSSPFYFCDLKLIMKHFFKSRIFRTLLCAELLLTSSCIKEPPAPAQTLIPKERLLPEEAKAYIAFKPGTYWVYQDSATGARDSVWVNYLYYKKDTGYDVLNNYLIYEYYELKTTSLLDGYFYYYELNSIYSSGSRNHIRRTKTKFGDYVGWTISFEYPIVPGNVLYGGAYDVTTTTNYYDSLNIKGIVYHKVSRLHNKENPTEYGCQTIFYLAKDFGIIRKVNLDSVSTWNLVKYQIIKQ